MSLSGKTALVTGASRGIGRAIAQRLARDGAAVALNYRVRATDADELAAAIRTAGGRALTAQADVADRRAVNAMVQRIEGELGPVDILINNAGKLARGDLGDFDFSEMEPMRKVNVDGLVHVTRAVVEGMKQRHSGRIINLTSIAAHGTALAGTTFYAATKAAVSLLTKRFAMELGPHGITVNAIAPGFIMTEMVTSGRSEAEVRVASESIANKTMMRRVGQPEDIAAAIAFLVSDEAAFITAQVITVDGGRMDYITHP
jgi:3-oxoacyl-[acyl-carrier protein] reductase